MKRNNRLEAMEAASTSSSSSSSSDSDSDNDSDSSSSSIDERDHHPCKDKNIDIVTKESDTDDPSSSDSDSSNSDYDDSINDNNNNDMKQRYHDDDNDNDESSNDDDSDSDSDDEQEDDINLTLEERLKRKHEQGISLKGIRSRKSRALVVANERLATLRKGNKKTQQQQQKQQQKSKDDKNWKNNKKEVEEDDDDDESNPEEEEIIKNNKKNKKKKKNRPTEVSSSRKAYYKRGAYQLNESGISIEIGANKYKPNDPRISNLNGHLNQQQFETNYEFVQELRTKEIEQLKQRIKVRQVSGKKGQKLRKKLSQKQQQGFNSTTLEDDKEQLKLLLQEKGDYERKRLDRIAKASVKKKIRDGVAEGKHGIYYLKRREQKRLELEAKFDELKKRGGDQAVDKVLAKRRRKNKSRDAGLFGF